MMTRNEFMIEMTRDEFDEILGGITLLIKAITLQDQKDIVGGLREGKRILAEWSNA